MIKMYRINITFKQDPFYNMVFQNWHNTFNTTMATELEVRNEVLWNNGYITTGMKLKFTEKI